MKLKVSRTFANLPGTLTIELIHLYVYTSWYAPYIRTASVHMPMRTHEYNTKEILDMSVSPMIMEKIQILDMFVSTMIMEKLSVSPMIMNKIMDMVRVTYDHAEKFVRQSFHC
jgi:hypothetical protein